MSKKIIGWLKYILLAVFAGIGIVQIIYAVIWAFLNGNNIQDFYDTAIYLQSASEFTSDGWRLPGYACILRLFGGLKFIIGDSYVVLLYLVQVLCSIAVFSYAVKVIVKIFWNRPCSWKKATAVAVYLVTLPVVWQMQFAVLPDALCLALMVLLFAQLLQLSFEHKTLNWGRIWIISGVFLFLGVMHHHYFYGAIALSVMTVIVLYIKQFFRTYRSKTGMLAGAFVLVIIVLTAFIRQGVNESVPKGEVYATHTITAELWSRFVYPHILEDFTSYPEQVQTALSEGISLTGKEMYEYYLTDIIPQIENYAGDNASQLCGNMVITGFRLHRNQAIKSFIKEGIAYGFMPLSVEKYMYNNGGSLYGHNLMKMWEKAPNLTVDYMHVSMNGFIAMCGMGIILFFIEMIIGNMKFRHLVKSVVAGGISVAGVIFPMMLFSIEKFDYRIGLFSVFMWGAITLSLIMEQEWRRNDEYRNDK